MPQRRYHILVIIPGMAGGTGTFCRSLGSGLQRLFGDQLKVSLLTIRGDAKQPENAIHFDQTFTLESEVHNDWRRILALFRSFWGIRSRVEEIRPDLVFTIGTFSNIVASLAVEGIPVVMSDHLNMSHRLRGQPFGRITRWFMRFAYPGRLMVAASKELADDLRDHFAVNRARIIPNGIDAEVVHRRAEEVPTVAVPDRYFMWIGRLTEQKDVGTLLRAFAHAKKNCLTDDLVIAGDGEERPMLEALAKELGVSSQVNFLGHCANPYPLIKRARALVLSSIWEGFAYAPIEAMGLGVPVISTACPSGPVEILGNGEFGLLVPVRDPAKLGDAMLQLSRDDSLHAQLSVKALERADQLSVENMARRYKEVFVAEIEGKLR